MKELFGIPMNSIMIVLLGVFALSMVSIAYVFVRNRVMFKMGLRNLVRRRLQTGLIVVGLMLATLIITAAFTTGDTIDHSISAESYSQYQRIDLQVNLRGDELQQDTEAPIYLSEGVVAGLDQQFAGDPDIDAFLPFLYEPVPAVDQRTGLSEPAINLSGIDPERLAAVGGLRLVDGGRFDVTTLGPDDVLLNKRAAEALDAKTGDAIVLHSTDGETSGTVAGIVEDELASGNIGEFDDVERSGGAVMLLSSVQAITGHQGKINQLDVALKGGVRGSLDRSSPAAERIESFLQSSDGQALLGTPSATLTVETVKQDAVEEAEAFGNMFTTIFIVFGLFSIAAGVMLIFMIFVMLAAERKPEMGMARAVGAQRTSLIQGFLAEGTSYNILAGGVGAALGVVASVVLVVGYLRYSLGGDFDFITAHVTARSLIVSYCLGASLTFLTVVIASVKVSSVNIVSAIRGTPEDEGIATQRKIQWRWVVLSIPAMIVPPLGVWVLLRKGFHVSWAWILGTSGVLLGALGVLMAKGNGSEMLFSLGFSLIPLSLASIAAHYKAPARVTWTLVGSFIAAYWLSPVSIGEKLLGRPLHGDIEMFFISGVMVVVAFTLIIIFNARLLTGLFQRDNGKTYRKAAFTAIAAVATAIVGFALGNTGDGIGELCYLVAGLIGLVAAFAYMAARMPSLAPALKMGVAYPLSNRFRTGMTIAMFSLIIFSLTTFSAVNRNFTALVSGGDADGGWDVVASVSRNAQLGDIRAQLKTAGSAQAAQIDQIGRTTVFIGEQQVRNVGDTDWSTYPVVAADDSFLAMPELVLDSRADGYKSDAAVVNDVRHRNDRALLDWNATQQDNGNSYDWTADVKQKDGSFSAFQVEFRDPATGTSRTVTVVGILATKLSDKTVGGLYLNEPTYSEVFGEPEYQRAYIRLVPGVDGKQAARGIESTLSTNGVQADSIRRLIDETGKQDQAFTRMFQAFMALGLFVGIAALGVIAFRSVVERRQQIGMLRAIGFQSRTVALTFVLESSFIALMGILSGVVGGAIVSHNLFTTGQFSDANVNFTMPWLEVMSFVVVAFVVSLVMTWWPSKSASNVPVADALRYE
jgi:putative ABC transport system permease protein